MNCNCVVGARRAPVMTVRPFVVVIEGGGRGLSTIGTTTYFVYAPSAAEAEGKVIAVHGGGFVKDCRPAEATSPGSGIYRLGCVA